MTTTIYSAVENNIATGWLDMRCRVDYDVTINPTNVVISGTMYLQAKGTSSKVNGRGEAIDNWFYSYYRPAIHAGRNAIFAFAYDRQYGSLWSIRATTYSSWTTLISASFTFTQDRFAAGSAEDSLYTKNYNMYPVVEGTNTTDTSGTYSNLCSTTAHVVTIPNLDTYTVSYSANGGGGAPSAQIKTYGVDLTLSSTEPTRTGYKFIEWNTSSDGSGSSYSPGDSYSANSNLTLYAIWQQKATVAITSVYRCDGLGTPDEAGGGLVAEFSIVSDFAVTASSLTITDGLVQHAVSAGTFPAGTINDAVQYDGYSSSTYIYPLTAYDVTLSVTTAAGTVTATTTLQPSSTYTRPTVTNLAVKRVTSDSSSTEDDLGRYLYATFDYSVFPSVQRQAPLLVEYTFQEVDGETRTLSPSTSSGSLSVHSVQFDYDDIAPGEVVEYAVTVTVADLFYSATVSATLSGGNYFTPRLSSVEAARSDYNGVFEDDGVTASVSLAWQVRATATQTAPQSIVINAYDDTDTLVATKTLTPSSANGTQTYVFQEADKTQSSTAPSGVVLEPDEAYTITATLYDLVNEASLSSAVTTAFFTMDFLSGGHGVAIGKPSTRAGLDIGMETHFDGPFTIAERLSLPVYKYASKPNESDLPSSPCIVVCEDGEVWLAVPGS